MGTLNAFALQEDALVMNARSLENGMFHSLQYDAYSKTRMCPTDQNEDTTTLVRIIF